jgi:peroxiredoxin
MFHRTIVTLFVCLGVLLAASSPGWAGKFNRKLNVGDAAPTFEKLPGIDGKMHSLDLYKDSKAVVIVFLCNHCPVAVAYEQRLIDFALEYQETKGVAVIAVSVSHRPEDALDKMKEHAVAKKFPFTYIHDASQDIGRNYGATATPHVFVLDKARKVAYMGAFDDSINPGKVETQYVRDAVEAILAGKQPEIGESRQIGCAIEYEKKKAPAEKK